MPLDDARRKQLEALLASGQTGNATTPQQTAGPSLPPEVEAIAASMNRSRGYGMSVPMVGGGRLTIPANAQSPREKLLMRDAERKLDIANPIPTETERERTPMAKGAVAFVDDFAKDLGIASQGKPIGHPEKIAAPGVREIVPQKFQDYAMSEDSAMAYNKLESAFQLGSIVLTGRQGDLQKLQQIRDVYAFGGGIKNKPRLAYSRYQNLRRLFQTFDRAQALPPEQQQSELNRASSQMDTLLSGKELAPSIDELDSKERAIVEDLLK